MVSHSFYKYSVVVFSFYIVAERVNNFVMIRNCALQCLKFKSWFQYFSSAINVCFHLIIEIVTNILASVFYILIKIIDVVHCKFFENHFSNLSFIGNAMEVQIISPCYLIISDLMQIFGSYVYNVVTMFNRRGVMLGA